MKKIFLVLAILLVAVLANAQPSAYKNIWDKAPSVIPSNVAVDAPLMGNGDLTMSLGYKDGTLSYYLSKNDFWRLRSKADGLSGPRVAGILDFKIESIGDAKFSAEQLLSTGVTTTWLKDNNNELEAKSWVSATSNVIFIELSAKTAPIKVSINLSAPDNSMSNLKTGTTEGIKWLTRSFVDSVDIATEVSIAMKSVNKGGSMLVVEPSKPLVLAIAVESNFKQNNTLQYVTKKVRKIKANNIAKLERQHNQWWSNYWSKSSIKVEDEVLMKAYYQGLYTLAACSRDPKFPPGIFGWNTTDTPNWNGDYHLNYNFQSPFYALYSANRIEQGDPHDAPLIDFMPRGEWYAKNVTNTRGILYPVGIGPLGIEVTRDFAQYMNGRDVEEGGLFFGQRSNSTYGLLNMAQRWRTTYDKAYGEKIYPYALAVASFWEDYLVYENGRYVIYGDAVHEGSGKDKNPILSLGLVRNAFNVMLDLSTTLQRDVKRQAKWLEILDKLSDFPIQTRNDKKVFRYTEEGTAWWNDNGLGIQHIYPGNAITLDDSDELLTVARNTIGEMQRWKDYNTTNSFFPAAIRVGYNPEVVMDELHKYAIRSYPNGFDLNNPHGIENSGTVANSLNEMLCMSVGNVIRLFNLPKGLDASFENIRAWGAFLVSAKLSSGIVSDLKIKSEKGKQLTIVNPWIGKDIVVYRNGKKAEQLSGSRVTFATKVNENIELKPL